MTKDSTYYKAILQNLFFATLNTPLGPKRKWVTRSNYGVQNYYRYKRFIKDEARFMEWMNQIPFLNGGLFENLDIIQTEDKENNIPKINIRVDCFSDNPKNESRLKVPDYLFFGTRQADISGFFEDNKKTDVEITGIIDILNRYDFTIDENTPDDQEVALDPELLGTVFENLLASYNPETQSTARKESGSFYTPRPIVDFMVRESLEYYLADAVTIDKDKLHKISNPEAELAFSDAEKTKIVSALSEIKILDPACGSGAFPMGCLQHIVQILNRLDPENEKWKAAQVTKLKQDLIDTIDNSDYENLKNKIDQVFSNQYNDADYARKLYLIQNCLYGVDIQPIAMQISKLRFFISLLVEQKIDRDDKNFGIIPLPNLETKFVAANTLLKLDKRVSTKKGNVGSGLFQNLFVEEKEEELAKVREKYFSARTPKTKRKWRAKDKALRQQIADLLIDDGWDNAAAHNIAQWDPFNQNTKADWFDPEWMFGVKAFDVVIGNPPYIKEYTYREAFDGVRNSPYYQGKMDIWYLFSCLSIDILNNKAVLSFIAQNNWITSAGASKLRNKILKDTEILNFIDFGNFKIFETAGIQTMVFVLRKTNPSKSYKTKYGLLQNDSIDRSRLKDFLFAEKNDTADFKNEIINFNPEIFIDEYISFNDNEINTILNKIKNKGKYYLSKNEVANGIHPHYDFVSRKLALKSSKRLSIGQGIFGLNRNELINLNLDSKEKELIKPYYNSDEIKKYITFIENEHWLIYTDSSFKKTANIKPYPKIKRHLDQFSDIITSDNHPYGLHRSRAERFFKGEKIVVQRKCADTPIFSYSNFDCYVSATYYVIKPDFLDSKFLTLYLNSKLVEFWLRHKGKMQGNNYQIDKAPLLGIPIIIPKDLKFYHKYFDRLIQNLENSISTTDLEALIDCKIYKSFDLAYDDILMIDPESPITKKEYENFTL